MCKKAYLNYKPKQKGLNLDYNNYIHKYNKCRLELALKMAFTIKPLPIQYINYLYKCANK